MQKAGVLLLFTVAAAAVVKAQIPAEGRIETRYDLPPIAAAGGFDSSELVRSRLFLEESVSRAVDWRLTERHASAGGALEHLLFQPFFEGIPLFDGEAQADVGRQGRLWRLSQKRLPGKFDSLDVRVSAVDAASIAAGAIGAARSPLVILSEETGPSRRTSIGPPGGPESASANLVWFDQNGTARLAWSLSLEPPSGGAWQAVVGARRAEIWLLMDLTRSWEPSGLVFAAPHTANPDAGPRTAETFTGWPAQADACSGQAHGAALQDGACWTAGGETSGNNASACVDEEGANRCTDQVYAAGGRFDFPFDDSYARIGDPIPDREAALVNAFYWVNVAHDWLYSLGFDEGSGNFQNGNGQRGGAGGDAVLVDVHDGGSPNNARMATPPDGRPPRMELGLFAASQRDSAFDADVLLHEYVHGMTSRLIGGRLNVIGLYLWQSGALSEGWSDAYAASLTGDPVVGEYVSRNRSTGIRSVRLDDNDLTFGQFGIRFPAAIPGAGALLTLPQVHHDGEIWASTMWDLRRALGQGRFEQLVTAALKLTPKRPSMLDARDAILQSARALQFEEANCQLWNVFAARGLGSSAALNPFEADQPNDTALSVYEAFDSPPSCGGQPESFPILLHEEGAERESGWTGDGLWHRSSRRAAQGQKGWYFGREDLGQYFTGGRVSGSLISPPIDLSGVGSAALEWRQVFRAQGFLHRVNLGGVYAPYLNADSGRVWISTDQGASWQIVTHLAHNSPTDGFVRYRIHLGRFAGRTIRVRFEFDSFDARDNRHEGWLVDDIRILGKLEERTDSVRRDNPDRGSTRARPPGRSGVQDR